MAKQKEEKTEETGSSWIASQPKPEPVVKQGYKLVELNRHPRRVVAEVPNEVVRFAQDGEGRRVLVFDGVRCSTGVVDFHGTKCFLDGEKAPEAAE